MEILYEDNHLIAVNKTNSDIVQVDKTGDESLEDKIKYYIKNKYQKPGNVFLGVTHRIDRPVSGAVVFARTSKALTRMNELFVQKEVKKIYWAIVKEKPPQISDTLKHYISRNQQKNISTAHDKEVKDSKLASLTYTLLASADNYHLLEIDLHTGRHHQIRCQLSKIGCPIKGDLKYGFPRSNPDGGISLHSRKIEFSHPVTKEKIIIVAKPPKDSLWDYFLNLIE
ncbi:MAG: RNA pseudouridine synthase [Bacteroidetes bacterium GWC2_33_15]|nr:MAG: RNA pseudouridine synthase [Bacteroidetes bacterium GWA2_33_15]OFX49498.1 MAG: RNA pseudouridine synthase [Bacteroidetes bacterium GWC2_33_15]OFX63663.1 MAG: RNA pseudouridine synthase [Bacteroidetes bacterium GWB2_32_14]OFX68877.1 MAG: RNA pseudouridine synthase [Bacteroidetes bacterium GWD2_33_33]HAN17521.1 RNA pseudouridine synthase [Bacteroidales bacterium]